MSSTNNNLMEFDGNPKDWRMWAMKFKAHSFKQGYQDHLDLQQVIPKKDDVKYLEYQEKNLVGYHDLLWCMGKPIDADIVDESKTSTHKDGCLKTAWKGLNEKYHPKDRFTKIKLVQRFNSLKRADCKSGVEWLNDMCRMRRMLRDIFNKEIDDEEFLEILYMNLPKRGYEALKVSYSRQKASKIDPLTFESFQSQLMDFEVDLKLERNVEGVQNLALTTGTPKAPAKKFEEMRGSRSALVPCEVCGKPGHSKDKCWSIPCHKCGFKGHDPEKCWKSMTCSKCNRTGHTEKH